MSNRFLHLAAVIFTICCFAFNLPAQNNQPNSAQTEELELSRIDVLIPCQPNMPTPPECKDDGKIKINTKISNLFQKVNYQYSVSGGKIIETSENIVWDLQGVRPGTYKIIATITNQNNSRKTVSKTVTVSSCNSCNGHCWECPTIVIITCTEKIRAGEIITFTANVTGGSQANVSYKWKLSNGEIIEGQATSAIKVKTTGLEEKEITATLEVGDICSVCENTASSTVKIE